jgi:tetratricopeptide (TPR) repeat protein
MSALSQPTDRTRKLAEDRYHAAVESLANGDLAVAIEGFRASLESDPTFADAAHGLIHALKDAAQFDEAIVVALQLIAADPEDVLAHTSLSILYQHQGRIPEAEAEATRAKLLGWKKQLREDAAPGMSG